MFPTSRRVIILCGAACLLALGASACGDRPVAPSAAGDASSGAPENPSPTDDSSYAGSGDEDGKCQPGQTRCHGDLGFQRCTPDGEWGSSQTCGGYSDNGTSSYCAVIDEGGGPWAACIDPACFWWLKSGVKLGDGRVGVCVGEDQLRP